MDILLLLLFCFLFTGLFTHITGVRWYAGRFRKIYFISRMYNIIYAINELHNKWRIIIND